MAKRGVKSQKNFNQGNYRHDKAWSKAAVKLDRSVKEYLKRDYIFLDYQGVNRITKMQQQLVRDVFGYVEPVDVRGSGLKESRLERIRELLSKYGKYDLLYKKKGNPEPRGAICADKGNTYLLRSHKHMPLEDFLLHFAGDDFIDQDSVCKVLSEWSGIPREKIYDAYIEIIWFFKRQNEAINMGLKRKIELPGLENNRSAAPTYINNGTINHNYFAPSSPVEP